MKTNLIIGLLLTATFLSAQQMYEVRTVTMKNNMAQLGMNIGSKYFSTALKELGVKGVTLRGMTGPYHGLIIYSVPEDDPFVDRYPDMLPHMIGYASSEDIYHKDLKKFNESILTQQLNIFQDLTDHAITEADYYVVRYIKFKQGRKQEGIDIGLKYFTQGLKSLGNEVNVLNSKSGPHDLIVVEPRVHENPLQDVDGGKLYAAWIKIAESEDQLQKDLANYNDCVLKEEKHYYKRM